MLRHSNAEKQKNLRLIKNENDEMIKEKGNLIY